MIAYNAGNGVALVAGPAAPKRVEIADPNYIFDNDGLGIDLGDDYVTPNDEGDPKADPPILPDLDSGPNDLQNFPDLTSAIASGSNTIITGTLRSNPNTTFFLEFFGNTDLDPSGFGEGEEFLGDSSQQPVVTDSSGYASFSFSFPVVFGSHVTATATDPDGSTSEFSGAVFLGGIANGVDRGGRNPTLDPKDPDSQPPADDPVQSTGRGRSQTDSPWAALLRPADLANGSALTFRSASGGGDRDEPTPPSTAGPNDSANLGTLGSGRTNRPVMDQTFADWTSTEFHARATSLIPWFERDADPLALAVWGDGL